MPSSFEHKNVECIEIRPSDGAQCFRYGPGICDVVWLMGIDKAPGMKVGEKGRLVYRNTSQRGFFTFEPEGITQHGCGHMQGRGAA